MWNFTNPNLSTPLAVTYVPTPPKILNTDSLAAHK